MRPVGGAGGSWPQVWDLASLQTDPEDKIDRNLLDGFGP